MTSARAQRVIGFIEKLKITIGEHAGRNFVLRPWQRKFIEDVYGPTRADGKRIVRRAIFSLPRKQGKSEIAAALILVHLCGPEAETNGEIYSAANDRAQASIVFNAVKRFVEASPQLKNYLRIVDSTKTIFVTRSDIKAKGSKFRALSSDAGRQHGLNPSLVIVDELAQAKSRELFDTLSTSQGARSEPLLMVISTQSHDPTHVLSEMIDDGLNNEDPTTVCHLYSARDGCDLMDEAAWHEANPALGDFLDLEAFRAEAARAVRLPSEEQNFRLLRLNQRVSPNASLITRADWQACQKDGWDFEPGEAIYLAYDNAIRADLAALVAVSVNNGSRAKAWLFKPADQAEEHGRRDGVPYAVWARQGWLQTPPGRSIDPRTVALKVAELCRAYQVDGLAYDRWHIDEFLRCLDDVGLEAQTGHGVGLRLVEWGQGFRDMSVAVNAFEHAVLAGELTHDGNPVLTFNVMNAVTESDGAGNRKLAKNRTRFRIDGAVALAMALGLKSEDRKAAVAKNPWEDPNFSLFGS
jgi:phage terminase large subunit-like protein